MSNIHKKVIPVILEIMGAVGIVLLAISGIKLARKELIPGSSVTGGVGFLLLLLSAILKPGR